VRQEDLGDRVGGIDEAGEVVVVDAVEDVVHVTERGECCAEVSLGMRALEGGVDLEWERSRRAYLQEGI
jgi:hypothetical protein